MAVYRAPYYCVICGHQFKEKHSSVEGIIGDTFLGYYEEHDCNLKKKLNMLIDNSENGKKVINQINKLIK